MLKLDMANLKFIITSFNSNFQKKVIITVTMKGQRKDSICVLPIFNNDRIPSMVQGDCRKLFFKLLIARAKKQLIT